MWEFPRQRRRDEAEPLTGGDSELRREQGKIVTGPESAPESDEWQSPWYNNNEEDLVLGSSAFELKPWLAEDQPSSEVSLPNSLSIGTVLLDPEQERQEPETPRPEERLHSPLWVPPPQKPPGRYQLLKLRMRTAAIPTSRKQEDYGKNKFCRRGGDRSARSLSPPQRRSRHTNPVSRPSTPPLTLELPRHRGPESSVEDRPPSVDGMGIRRRSAAAAAAASYDASKRVRCKRAVGFTTDHSNKTMTAEDVSEDMQSSMVIVQGIRDRYLRCVSLIKCVQATATNRLGLS